MRRFADMNYYAILGVPSSATKEQIKAAYRELARTTHPDAGGDHERFAQIAEAWEVLSDDDEREYYDADRALQMRASRPYTRTASSSPSSSTKPADEEDDGLTERERWMRNKRRF
jgi:curved DNA-binding protein CbpA